IKGRINRETGSDVKNDPCRIIDAKRPGAVASPRRPGKSGDSGKCRQFDGFSEALFILNPNNSKNERVCLKCGGFTYPDAKERRSLLPYQREMTCASHRSRPLVSFLRLSSLRCSRERPRPARTWPMPRSATKPAF